MSLNQSPSFYLFAHPMANKPRSEYDHDLIYSANADEVASLSSSKQLNPAPARSMNDRRLEKRRSNHKRKPKHSWFNRNETVADAPHYHCYTRCTLQSRRATASQGKLMNAPSFRSLLTHFSHPLCMRRHCGCVSVDALLLPRKTCAVCTPMHTRIKYWTIKLFLSVIKLVAFCAVMLGRGYVSMTSAHGLVFPFVCPVLDVVGESSRMSEYYHVPLGSSECAEDPI